MRWTKWIAVVAVLAAGCADYDSGGKSAYQAPLLSSDTSQVLELRGAVDFGGAVHESFSANKALTGYVFNANAGARVSATLTSRNGEDPVLILYGPMDRKGIWGGSIALDDDGQDGRNSLISDFALPATGRYLIAAGTYEGNNGGPFDLLLGCRGTCEETHCPDLMCDLYCPGGFMTDPDGCFVCQCSDAECSMDEDCPLYPWIDAPGRCVDGVCVYEQAECQTDADCPEGEKCILVGIAYPCDEEDCTNRLFGYCQKPACASDMDCVFPDGTMGSCIEGQCIPVAIECGDDMVCPEGMVCDRGVCVPVPPPDCQSDADCPEGFICVTECWSALCDPATGWCPPECDPQTGECPPVCKNTCVPSGFQCRVDTDCIDAAGNVLGRCVNGLCVFDEIRCQSDWECPPGTLCQIQECIPGCDPATDPFCCFGTCKPSADECISDEECIISSVDPDGNMVTIQGRCIGGKCIFDQCMCPDIWEPVCGEVCDFDCPPEDPACGGNCYQITVPNECTAACQGIRIVHPGTCENQPAECWTDEECGPGFICEFFCELCDETDPNCQGMECRGFCTPQQGSECVVTGCNGEICAPFPVNSTCAWLPEYGCLQLTTCELLTTSSGEQTCGWVQTEEYLQCLNGVQNAGECSTDAECPFGTICQKFCDGGECRTVCLAQDCVCPDVSEPVCGVDGVTYDNFCFAICNGSEVLFPGPCE